jgi:hypothetical protein
MAMFCIVFSSASKKLIELRLDQKFYHCYAIGNITNKRIKDGSRDRREHFQKSVQSIKNSPDDSNPDLLFIPPDDLSLSLVLSSFTHSCAAAVPIQPDVIADGLPLYLRIRKLQV